MYLGFRWYAANVFRLPMVRRKNIQASSGSPQIDLGFQWYAELLSRLPVVQREFKIH